LASKKNVRFCPLGRAFHIRGITLNNPNERDPRHKGIHFFQKDLLAGLLGYDCEAAIGKNSLFNASIFSSHRLKRPDFSDFR
jgi:hypothetical protein